MFRCQLTGRQSSLGVSPVRLITHRRHRTYDKTVYDLESRTVSTITAASSGWEIVREMSVCQSAADEWIAAHPDGAEWIDSPAQVDTVSEQEQ